MGRYTELARMRIEGKENPAERLCEEVMRITKEIRELSKEYGVELRFQTVMSPHPDNVGKIGTESWIGSRYRYDIFFDGSEKLSCKFKTITPSQILLDHAPDERYIREHAIREERSDAHH